MKKKIKAFILAIIICITTFFSNIVNATATVPGIVEAENIWLTLETLALSMGVSLPFIPDKSISYNNNQKKQEIIDYIDKELSDGVITQQQHDDAIQQLDDMLLLPGEHGVGSAINIGTQLWDSLTKLYFNKYIKTETSLVSNFSGDALSYINNYEGKCAIYGFFRGDIAGVPGNYVFVMGDTVLESPTRVNPNYTGEYNAWWVTNGNAAFSYITDQYNGNVTYGTSPYFTYFQGTNIYVQYWAYKTRNEDISPSTNENALTGANSYEDYLDKLSDIYSLQNGQVVVTDSGEAPTVLDGDTIADTVAGINDGTVAWDNAIPQIYANEDSGAIEGETPVIGEKALDEMVTGLNLNRLKTKFPFCIPSDLKQMIEGAGQTDDEAPTISVPCHIEFAGHVYYDSDELFIIDFNELQNVVTVFRAGFFLLFLIGMVYLTIEVLHSFFVVTE